MMKNVHIGWGPVGLTKIKSLSKLKLQLNKSNYTGELDSEFKLIITSEYEEIPVWQSSNEDVAKVDLDGNVTLVGEGSATITVTLGDLIGTCSVKVVLSKEQQLRKDIAKGGTVKLTSDVVLTSPLQIDNTVTINLNGYELKNETATASGKCQVFLVRDGANLTIEGEGTVYASAKCSSAKAIWLYDGGSVNIKGGTYMQEGIEGEGKELIYVQKGELTISGGTFIQKYPVPEVSNSYATVNCLDSNYKNGTAKVIITGGLFPKFNPADNMSEGSNTSYVANGYEAVEIEPNVWEVKKSESKLDNTKIYYGTIQSPTFMSYSELTESEVERAVKEGTLKTMSLNPVETTITIHNQGDAVVILVPSNVYKAYKDFGDGTKVKFDETVSGYNVEANGEIRLGDFYIFGEMSFLATGQLKIYVE